MKSKKIILFIVEGITEQICLGNILQKLIATELMKFEITHGDITSKDEVDAGNIVRILGDLIKDYADRNKYTDKDFEKVVHLIDTDGVFIPNASVITHPDSDVTYGPDEIHTNKVEKIIRRNEQKRQVINRLYTLPKVRRNIDYIAYFFSSNLDHVLHGDANLSNDRKLELANLFEERYYNSPEKFLEYINSDLFRVDGDHRASWNYIMQNNNSIHRHTNFHLFFH
jgi:hypothetical protein